MQGDKDFVFHNVLEMAFNVTIPTKLEKALRKLTIDEMFLLAKTIKSGYTSDRKQDKFVGDGPFVAIQEAWCPGTNEQE